MLNYRLQPLLLVALLGSPLLSKEVTLVNASAERWLLRRAADDALGRGRVSVALQPGVTHCLEAGSFTLVDPLRSPACTLQVTGAGASTALEILDARPGLWKVLRQKGPGLALIITGETEPAPTAGDALPAATTEGEVSTPAASPARSPMRLGGAPRLTPQENPHSALIRAAAGTRAALRHAVVSLDTSKASSRTPRSRRLEVEATMLMATAALHRHEAEYHRFEADGYAMKVARLSPAPAPAKDRLAMHRKSTAGWCAALQASHAEKARVKQKLATKMQGRGTARRALANAWVWSETCEGRLQEYRALLALPMAEAGGQSSLAARVAAARETSRQCFASARRAYLESAIENESTPVAGMSSQAFQAQQAKDLEALEALQRSLAGLFKELEAQVNVRADLQVPVTVVEPEEPA